MTRTAEPAPNRTAPSLEGAERTEQPWLIRYRVGLGVAVSLLVALAVGAVAWANFVNTRAAIVTLTDERLDALFGKLEERVKSHMERAIPAMKLSQMMVRDEVIPGDRDGLARYFVLVLRANPSFSWASYSDEGGSFTGAYRDPQHALHVCQSTVQNDASDNREYIVGENGEWTPAEPDAPYDPRIDKFYETAKDARQPVWIGPYIFFGEGIPGITYAIPHLAPDGHVRGVFTADFNFNVLSDFVAELSLGEHGRVFVLTPDDIVVAHPELRSEGGPGQGSKGELVTVAADPLLQAFAAARRVAAGGGNPAGARFSFHYEGQRFVAGYQILEIDGGLSWILSAYAPESDFMGVLARNRMAALLVATLALGFGVLVTLVLARRIAAPLATLASEMEEIGDFQLSDRPGMRTIFREIAMMDRSLLKMKGGLRSFAYYVPTDLVRAVLASGQEVRLEGHTRELSVYFSDIVGFTSIAETMTPDELVRNMGQYFDEMTRIIAACGGTIDKFIGDAVMAFWGAPTPAAGHAGQACVAAIRSQRKLAELRATATEPWLAQMHARIGIATGEVVVGNFGTPERFNYTAMGDTVNLASRLESLGKQYGTSILVSEATYEAARALVVGRPVDIVQVKGKHRSVRVYELLCLTSDDDEAARALAAASEQGLAAYVALDFQRAAGHFERVLQLRPQDQPATLLLSRCRRFLISPPPAEWNGVYVAAEK